MNRKLTEILAGILISVFSIVTISEAQDMDKNQALTKEADTMKSISISRAGSQPSTKGSAEFFMDSVRIDPLFKANDPLRASGGRVTFEPGAGQRGTPTRSGRY